MDTAAASQLVFDALAHAVAGDAKGAFTAMQTLGQQSDGAMMYGACCGLAQAGALMLKKFYGDQAPKPGEGMWVMEQLKPDAPADPAETFGMRFLIAWANGDTDTCDALHLAAWKATDDQYVDSIAALLATVAGITRLALDKQRGDRS